MDGWLLAAEDVPGWTRGDEARELFRRVNALPANAVVVEIGTFFGGGAVVMGGARKEAGSGVVHSVDPFDLSGDSFSVPYYQDILARHGGGAPRAHFDGYIARNALDGWVVAHEGYAVDVAATWSTPIDFLFLDGDQSPAGARAAYEAWVPFLKPGGTIAVHNSSPGWRDIDHYGMVMLVGSQGFYDVVTDQVVIGTTTFGTLKARYEPSAPQDRLRVRMIQTCDADIYYDLLIQSARTVREYCRRNGYSYESYVGVKRGYYPWHASFNQVYMLKELLERDQHDWLFYLDADAYVADLSFDLPAYLADKGDYGAIMTPAHDDGPWWDVNTGVLALNLRHPVGRKLIAEWHDAFERIYSPQVLESASIVFTSPHDQDLLQAILQRHEAEMRAHIHLDDRTVLNAPQARFVRQMLREFQPDLTGRIDAVCAAADALLANHADPNDVRAAQDRQEKEAFLATAYELVLGRPIDDGGRAAYLGVIETFGARTGPLHVLRALMLSDEFAARVKPVAAREVATN